ncbi:MAG: hypothetical protein RSA86_00885 [Christensenellaceae bacterium]
MENNSQKPLSLLTVITGGLSFLIFAPAVWWLGLIFAVIALFTGFSLIKTQKTFALIGIVLAIIAAATYVIMLISVGAMTLYS